MKKKLNKIFDEATPNELDRFSDALGAPEASGEELAAIKSKVYAHLETKKKKRAPAKIWFRVGIIAACVALVIGVIATVVMLQGGETWQDVHTEKENKGYVIYLADSYSYDPLTLESKENAKVKVSSEQKKFYLPTSELERDENAPDTFVCYIGADEITFNFKKTYEMGERKLNKYEAEDRTYIEIDAITGELAFFSSKSGLKKEDGDLSEEQAKKIAEDTICKLYGANTLNEYKHKVTIKNDKDRKFYANVYSKYVHGVVTNDDIEICVNMKGEVTSINALYKGTLAGIEKEVSQKDIEDALSAVKEYLGDEWIIDDYKEIVSDSQGDYYINAFIRRTVDGEVQSETIYININ